MIGNDNRFTKEKLSKMAHEAVHKTFATKQLAVVCSASSSKV